MSDKRKSFHLNLSDARKKKSPSMSQLAYTIVHHCISEGKGRIPTASRALLREGGYPLINFNKELKKYHYNDYEVEFRLIDDVIGIGAFAKQDISKNTELRNICGVFGKRLNEKEATNDHSSVTKDEGDTTIHRKLLGNISFFNHACAKHNNCIARFKPPHDTDDYKIVQTRKNVKQGEELTLLYDEECSLQCRTCAELEKKKKQREQAKKKRAELEKKKKKQREQAKNKREEAKKKKNKT